MPPIIGLPGLLCLPSVFDGVREHPVLARMRALDLPDLDNFPAIAQALAEKVEPDTIVVGMSMGSYLCFELTRLVPERIAGLVLIGTQSAADAPEAAAMRAKSTAWARRAGMEVLAEVVCDQMLGAAARHDQAVRDQFASMAVSIGVDTFARHQAALAARPDATARLPQIACLVAVLTGAEDKVTPPSAGQAVAQGVRRGSFSLIEKVGHLPVIEAPSIIARHLADFVTSVRQREAVA